MFGYTNQTIKESHKHYYGRCKWPLFNIIFLKDVLFTFLFIYYETQIKLNKKRVEILTNFIYLFLAIIFETCATSLLKLADGFTKPLPTIMSIIFYIGSFYCLSNCLKTMPIGIVYAIWSGLGIVILTIVGIFAFKQTPDWVTIIGLLLIISGVVVLNLFSKMVIH